GWWFWAVRGVLRVVCGRPSALSCCFSMARAAAGASALSLHDALPILEVRRSAESRGRSSLPDPFCGLSARDELLCPGPTERFLLDRKSTRLNSSHVKISYAVFCFKKSI